MDNGRHVVGWSRLVVRFALCLLGVVALFLGARRALADDRSDSEALYQLAQEEDAAFDFKNALTHYEASAARLPSSRFTPRANRRAAELRTHAEGDFVPLLKLETVRRSAKLADDGAVIDALVKDAASFPPGRVRVEARMVAAEAYSGRLARKEEAAPLLRLVVEDPNAEVLTARESATELVAAYVAKKDLASALSAAEMYARFLTPNAVRDVKRLIRRGSFRAVALLDLGTLLVAAMIVLASRERRRAVGALLRFAPMAALFAALATFAGGFLASRYEQTSPYPFTWMFFWMCGVFALTRLWSAGGSSSVAARTVRGAIGFTAVFAAAFLLLDRMDATYLSGFGL